MTPLKKEVMYKKSVAERLICMLKDKQNLCQLSDTEARPEKEHNKAPY
jgi:hypothetical protein